MVEEFEKSECYKHKTEEERKEIIEFLKEEPNALVIQLNIQVGSPID